MTDRELRETVWEPGLRGSIEKLGDLEVGVLYDVAERLAMGQRIYGRLTLHKKNWAKELYEEVLDGIVYAAMWLRSRK